MSLWSRVLFTLHNLTTSDKFHYFAFNSTIATMDVFGGNGTDSFFIGQMFNDNSTARGVLLSDPVHTTLTTKGYLSDGCTHPVTINGGYGGDLFDVLRNKCILDLNGESGDDIFTVRSFIAVETDSGDLLYNTTGQVNLHGDSKECTENNLDDESCDDGGDGKCAHSVCSIFILNRLLKSHQITCVCIHRFIQRCITRRRIPRLYCKLPC